MDNHNDTNILSGWEDKVINIARLLNYTERIGNKL